MTHSFRNGSLNPKKLLKGLLRRWYLFLFSVSLALGAAYFYLKYAPKKYVVRASLLINGQPAPGNPLTGSGITPAPAGEPTTLDDETALLTSYKLLRETLERMRVPVSYFSRNHFITQEEYLNAPYSIQVDAERAQLVNVPVYINLVDKHLYQLHISARNVKVYDLLNDRLIDELPELNITKTLRVGQPYRDKYLSFTAVFNQPPEMFYKDEYFFVINSLEERITEYARKLEVKPRSQEGHVLELTSRGEVPQKEKDFLNTLLAVYLDHDLRKKNAAIEETIAFIDRQLGVSRDSVRDTSRPVETHAAASQERIARRMQKYEALWQNLKNNDDFLAPDTNDEDPDLRNLLRVHAKLVAEKNALQFVGEPDSDGFEKTEAQLRRIRNVMENKVVTLLNNLRVEHNRLSEASSAAALPPRPGSPAGEDLLRIRQKLALDNHIYDYLLERRADAGMAAATTPVNKTIIDPARVESNRPVSPEPFRVYTIATLLGLILPLGLIFLKRLLQDKIINQEDIELNTRIPTLGVVGYNDKANNYLVAFSSRSALAESFRSIRVNLQYLFLDTEKKVLAVTSSQQGEGKTFCATNLSVVMAQSGKKTLLIDTDLRKPRVAARFDLENVKGLATYLTGMHDLKDVIQVSEVENLHIISSGPIPTNPLNLIGNIRMETLMEWARREYDYVMIDTPPIGLVSDFLILMNYTDFNIYIVRHKLTERNGLSKINELYETNRIKNVGILINGVRSMSAYGYSEKVYRYGYGD